MEWWSYGNSDVPAPAWTGSPGFGLALGSSGFVKSQARPKAKKLAWPDLAWLWPRLGLISDIINIP